MLNGRFGPYITNGKKNAKIPKDRDPKSITLEEAKVMIEQAPERGTGRFGRGKRGKTPAEKRRARPLRVAMARAARRKTKPRSPLPVRRRSLLRGQACGRLPRKPTKSARGSSPVPKGVTNVVRKGRSAPAKAHARKTAARAEHAALGRLPSALEADNRRALALTVQPRSALVPGGHVHCQDYVGQMPSSALAEMLTGCFGLH